MPIHIYHDRDADLACLKPLTIAVLGYGSQGHAHAQNLRDGGFRVLVAQRPGGPNHKRALADGFEPISIAEAARRADLLVFALPDELTGSVFAESVSPYLRPGQTLGFIHGFAVRFRQVIPPAGADVIMVAPKGPGSLVRERFKQGSGVACFFAVHQDATSKARQTALAWGAAIGGGRLGMIETSFATECESDLFGEQTVLCGGVIELMKAAYETLVEAGYPAEAAYFECIHEVKQIVDLVYADGLGGMREKISNTAAYGGLTRGPRLVTEETRKEMRTILEEIRSGRFAEDWLTDCRKGTPVLARLAQTEAGHPCEAAGRTIRGMGCSPPSTGVK